MGKIFINEETLIGIGNAIREKSGTTDLINTTDMANAILNLPSGGGGGTLKQVHPTTWQYSASSQNCSTATLDISEYVGTTDDKGFIISISGGTSSSYYATLVFFYDGSQFYQLTGGSDNRNITYGPHTASLSNGVLSIKFTKGQIIKGTAFTLSYGSAQATTLIYVE